MKKLLILCLTAGAACGSDAVDTANHFDGFYLGLGMNHTTNKIRGDVEAKEQDLRGLRVSMSNISRFAKKDLSRLGGSAIVGYRVLEGDFSFGIEGGVDASKNKKSDFSENLDYTQNGRPYEIRNANGRVCTTGIVPSVALVAGWKLPDIDGLLFAKLGASCNQMKYIDNTLDEARVRKMKFILPFVGFGFEKHLGDGFGLRAECTINLKAKKTITLTDDNNLKYSFKAKNQGVTIRILITKSI